MKKILCLILMIFTFLIFNDNLEYLKIQEQTNDNNKTKLSNVVNSLGNYYDKEVLDFEPVYNKYNLATTLKPGDIIFEWAGGAGVTHHIAVVESIQYSTIYKVHYVRVIEAVSTGVHYGILDDYRFDEKIDTVLRYENLTNDQWNLIKYFLEQQLGKTYLINPEINGNINQEVWYCSQLCWAAYKYSGITLTGVNSIPLPIDFKESPALSTIELSSHSHSYVSYNYNYTQHYKKCDYCSSGYHENHLFINGISNKRCAVCNYTINNDGSIILKKFNKYDI